MGSNPKGIDHATAVAWVNKLHTITETLDSKHWLDTATTPDIHLKFYSLPMRKGREEVEALLRPFFAKLRLLEHEIQNTDWVSPRIYHQCIGHFHIKRADAVEEVVSMDVLAVYYIKEQEDGTIKSYRMEFYGDPSELNQRLVAAG